MIQGIGLLGVVADLVFHILHGGTKLMQRGCHGTFYRSEGPVEVGDGISCACGGGGAQLQVGAVFNH